MNVQQALWHIIEKTHFNDFDFTDEFIEMIKTNPEYDGLYDIIDLWICCNFNIKKNVWKEIITSNPYPLVQQIINIYNLNYSLFQFEEANDFSKKTLNMIYEEIDKIFEEKKDNSEPHMNILIMLSYVFECITLQSHKYINNPIIQKCIAFADVKKITKTRNINLIKKQTDIFEEKYPDVSTHWIKCITTMTQMIDSKQDIKQIARCTDILFPNKQMTMYADILYFKQLCGQLQRMRLEKKYKYADYMIDIPPYDGFTDMFNHDIQIVRLTFEADMKKDNLNYISYLKNLLENNNKLISPSLFVDYISMLFNNRNYTEVYDMYIKYKKHIIHAIQCPISTMVKLNLIFVIIKSSYYTNKNISNKEFKEIMANIKPEEYVDTGIIKNAYVDINSIINTIESRDRTITIQGFDIVDRSKVDETCLICLEEIDDMNTETVLCICCKKELGHINCIFNWIKTKQTCPNCRSSVEQRISTRE